MLAAAATMTSRVRLGTMVTPLARRRPWVLARQVTTVDHLSHGRAVLGVGLGVPPEAEYAAFGESADPAEHAALVDEGLDVIDALWTGEPVTHTGPRHRLRDVTFLPRPVQRPAHEVAGIVGEISSRRTSDGAFDVVVWVLAEDAEACAEYERAGATWLIHGPAPGDDWLDDRRRIAAGGPPA